MKNFIIQHWPSIAIIGAFLIYAGILAWQKKWDQLRANAYHLMLQAEAVITGTKRGQERFEQVFIALYDMIPAWLRFWFPETLVREKLQDWYNNTLKDFLDNGKIDGSQDGKPPDTTIS